MFHRSTVDDIKHTVLEEFKKPSSVIRVVVATSSFEMRLDFPDVSIVVNVSAPQSLESFVQKSGRGGCSIEQSYSVLLWQGSLAKKAMSDIPWKVSDCREINDPMDIDEEINIMLDDEQRNFLRASLEEYRDGVFNVDNHLHEMSSSTWKMLIEQIMLSADVIYDSEDIFSETVLEDSSTAADILDIILEIRE
eukprot:gene4036-4584_t